MYLTLLRRGRLSAAVPGLRRRLRSWAVRAACVMHMNEEPSGEADPPQREEGSACLRASDAEHLSSGLAQRAVVPPRGQGIGLVSSESGHPRAPGYPAESTQSILPR